MSFEERNPHSAKEEEEKEEEEEEEENGIEKRLACSPFLYGRHLELSQTGLRLLEHWIGTMCATLLLAMRSEKRAFGAIRGRSSRTTDSPTLGKSLTLTRQNAQHVGQESERVWREIHIIDSTIRNWHITTRFMNPEAPFFPSA